MKGWLINVCCTSGTRGLLTALKENGKEGKKGSQPLEEQAVTVILARE